MDVGAQVPQTVPVAALRRWRNSYNSALHACGNKSLQERKADLAIRVCVECLWQLDTEDIGESEKIRAALADLRVLKALYIRYR